MIYSRNILLVLLSLMFLSHIMLTVTGMDQPLTPLFAAGSSFLESEAGVTAYSQLSTPIDLTQAKQAYKNIEHETADYLIGSVSLPGYGETHDVHVYLDTDGWIAAYYFANEPAAKIVDWRDYGGSIIPTKLEDALWKVANQISRGLPYTSFYDFRNPSATKITIITDEKVGEAGVDTFTLYVPGEYVLYDRSWSHALRADFFGGATSGSITLGGTELHSGSTAGVGTGWWIWEGGINPTLLPKDTWLTVTVSNSAGSAYYGSYVAIILIYAE